VRAFQPLPAPTTSPASDFDQRLVELAEVVGLELPPPLPPDVPLSRRRWRNQVRQDLGDHCSATTGGGEWFGPLLSAAVLDPDPSFCRQLIQPAVDAFGHRPVMIELIRYLGHGTTAERAGAARAWYAAQVPLRYGDESDGPTAESLARSAAVADLRRAWRETALDVFLSDEDLDVRRCVLPALCLALDHYPEELHGRVEHAIHVARTHEDDYIRHRIEHQVSHTC
jgi:hypothetical protein